jgi:hypothetical protein
MMSIDKKQACGTTCITQDLRQSAAGMNGSKNQEWRGSAREERGR